MMTATLLMMAMTITMGQDYIQLEGLKPKRVMLFQHAGYVLSASSNMSA